MNCTRFDGQRNKSNKARTTDLLVVCKKGMAVWTTVLAKQAAVLTNEEIRASSLQFVRKLSGFTKPSKANDVAFARAVDQVAQAAHQLLESLVTNAPPKDRGVETEKARARTAERFRSPVAEHAP